MINELISKISRRRSKVVIDRIKPYIKNSSRLIDIGSGTGDIADLLNKQGINITPVDVVDFHGPRLVKTVYMMAKLCLFQANRLIQHFY